MCERLGVGHHTWGIRPRERAGHLCGVATYRDLGELNKDLRREVKFRYNTRLAHVKARRYNEWRSPYHNRHNYETEWQAEKRQP
jgi:hypothetical protein